MTYVPRYCVWELTLACNAKCLHCGSNAGKARAHELNTEEAMALIDALAEFGCESITLSGGEPFIRPDWPQVAKRIRESGMRLEAITNGLRVTDQADTIAESGFFAVSFSIDGTHEVHDHLRGVQDGLKRLLQGACALQKRGVRTGAVTQVNKRNLKELSSTHRLLVDEGFEGWQLQLTMPYGRAAHKDLDIHITPKELLILEQSLTRICEQTSIFVQAADNIGYMGKSEPLIRSGKGKKQQFWTGCQAGLSVVGITSEGTVRGCLSMPPDLNEGNLRQRPLRQIWNDEHAFVYNRRFNKEMLRQNCADCALGHICRGGCKSMAFILTGHTSANPMCLRHLYNSSSC